MWLVDQQGSEPLFPRLAALQGFHAAMEEASDSARKFLEPCNLQGAWQQWCEKERERLLAATLAQAQDRAKGLQQKVADVMGGLTSLPQSSDEGPFRSAVQERINSLSASSTFLKKRADEMQSLLDILGFEKSAEANQFGDTLKQRMLEARAVSQAVVATLCYFAALTLFRSSAIGGKSEQSKKAATDLHALVTSCLNEMELNHPCSWLDEGAMEELLLQMGEAVPFTCRMM